jgi:hypothetical protein
MIRKTMLMCLPMTSWRTRCLAMSAVDTVSKPLSSSSRSRLPERGQAQSEMGSRRLCCTARTAHDHYGWVSQPRPLTCVLTSRLPTRPAAPSAPTPRAAPSYCTIELFVGDVGIRVPYCRQGDGEFSCITFTCTDREPLR